MLVEEIMSDGIISVNITDGIIDIARKMSEENIGLVGIKENGMLVGIITDRDIVTKMLVNRSLNVVEYMSKEIITIEKDETVDDALKKMGEHQIKRLIVTESGNQIGVISISDILSLGFSTLLSDTFSKIYSIEKKD